MNNMNDVAVIGMGPAGISAAIYLKRFGYEPICFESKKVGGKLNEIKEIENYPGFIGEGKDLALLLSKQVEHFNLNVKNEFVTKIERDYDNGTFIIKSDSTSYNFKAVVITTGIREKPFEIPGSSSYSNNGISRCATCDGPFYRNKTVSLIGTSSSAYEDAAYLANICEKVYLINDGSEVKANEELQKEIGENSKIEVLSPYKIISSSGTNHLEKLVLKNNENGKEKTIDTSALFILIGATPITEFIDYMDILSPQGFIISNDKMETSVKGVFVAGDARVTPLRQVVTATSDGSLAALSAKNYLKGLK